MYYHILLTELCNSECKYCYEKSIKETYNLKEVFDFDFSAPEKSMVKIEELKKFIEKDKNAVIVFYGGEPLLEIEKIKEIIDNVKNHTLKCMACLVFEHLRNLSKDF